MTEIAVISDLVETQDEDNEFLFLTLKKKINVWYIKTKLPDGDIKYQRYATKPATTTYGQFTLVGQGLTDTDIQDRKGIIQDRINALSKEGFNVAPKYISLFISGKIKELILSRKHHKTNHQKTKQQSKPKNEVVEKGESIEEIDDSPIARLLRRHMQRDS